METNRPHYNIVFSIPIHERFDVVIDQCINFFHFNPECAIVFHISKVFNYQDARMTKEDFLSVVKRIGNIYINPQSLRTGLLDIIQAHLSNFAFISDLCDFECFSMSASNDMFVRQGLYSNIKQYDAGLKLIEIDDKSTWDMGIKANEDTDLKNYLNQHGGKIWGAQIEGSFYKKSVYEKIASMINSFYDYNKMKIFYAREEIYFSTMLLLLAEQESLSINRSGYFTWINWASKTLFVRISDVKRIAKSSSQFFAIKRCERDNNDILRAYIRQSSGTYDFVSRFVDDVHRFSNFHIHIGELQRIVNNRIDRIIMGLKRLILKIIRH